MGLQQFERRLERLVEGAFAKVFRSGLQPVEVGRRVTREMDVHRTVGVRGTITPNVFHIALAPADLDRFEPFADTLVRDLADMARQHARDEGYQLLGPVSVELERDEALNPGMFLVTSEVREGADGGPGGAVVLADGTRVEVSLEPLVLGRLTECDVVLADPNVSRRHAEIRRDGTGFTIVDLGSTNGTRVNGAGVRERRLADGDQITVGSTTLRFETT